MKSESHSREPLVIVAVLSAMCAVFVLDMSIELGVAGAVSYLVAVWVAFFSRRTWLIWAVAAGCSLLTAVGFVFSPPGGELWQVLANRGIALSAIWLTTIIAARIRPHAVDQVPPGSSQTTLPLGIGKTGTNQPARLGMTLWSIIALSLGIHVACLIAGSTLLVNWRWPHHPVHAAVEMAGGMIALWVAWMLMSLQQRGVGTSFNVWIAGALIGMGVLDGLHALVHAGQEFVWLHSTATFVGGVLFLFVWAPPKWQRHVRLWWPWAVLTAVMAFGISSLIWPTLTPPMLIIDKSGHKVFSLWAQMLNVVGGVLLLAASTKLYLAYRNGKNIDDLLFFLHCILFGSAAIMFEQSQLWDVAWWGWHLLRLMAYGVALWFVVLTDERDARDIRERARTLAEFSAIIESTDDAILGKSLDGIVTSWNGGAERLYGYSADEMIGQSITRLVPAGHDDEVPSILNRLRKGQTIDRYENVRVRKDGSTIDVALTISPIHDSEGVPIGASTIARDVSARKRLEQRFRATVESAPTAMVMVDASGEIVLVNGESESLFGYTREELLQQKIEILVPERFRQDHCEHRESFFDAKDSRRTGAGRELLAVRKDGSEFPVEIGLSPIETDDGLYVLSAVIDITERKRAEEEIKRINDELRQKNDEMQQFVYTVSHDLKSPLVTCKGFIGLMREDVDAERWNDVRDSLGRIERAADRMSELITDLLDLSRIGVIRNDPEHVDVVELVQTVVDGLSARLDEFGVKLAIQEDLPPVLADRVRLTEVFENLLSNAIKYGCHVEPPRITVGSESVDGQQRYFVQDNGPGIKKEFHDKVFTLFQRLHTDKEGTGVGLAAVARIMEVHGGSVGLESDEGQGAKFWIAFPG